MASTDDFQLSGFVRVVGGYLDEEKAAFEGYDNSLSFGQDSLFGIQGEYSFTEQLSFTIQAIAHTGGDRDSGVEWAYLTYRPNNAWQVKLGEMRTSFYNLSDVLDVGFAYPYITPPQPVYNGYLFDQYRGIDVTYDTAVDQVRLGFETFYGEYDDDTQVSGDCYATKAEDMYALIGKLGYENINVRIGYFTGDVTVGIPELDMFNAFLHQLGLTGIASQLAPKGQIDVYQQSIDYDGLLFFAKAEHVKISSDFVIAPESDSYYITGGVNLPPFSFHLTWGANDIDYTVPENPLPFGIDPILDLFAASYPMIVDSLPRDDIETLSIGARWDLRHDVALKAEISHLDGSNGNRGFFEFDNSTMNVDKKAMLYQVALEWVF